MTLLRLDCTTRIADRLNELAAVVKTRARVSLTDGSKILETIAKRFFNALYGWDLVNLNTEKANYPAADLGDRKRRIAIQVTVQEGSKKISHSAAKAIEHKLGKDFDHLIVFFLLPNKPSFPKKFVQPPGGPEIETQGITDLLEELKEANDLEALAKAAKVLDEEMGKIAVSVVGFKTYTSHTFKYAPDELIGREDELAALDTAWASGEGKLSSIQGVPKLNIITFVASGGVGKTSLVKCWADDKLSKPDHSGIERHFDYSFYNQGTSRGSDSDDFFRKALVFFGDQVLARGKADPQTKGSRLAELVGKYRTLLILDGLEPLQDARSGHLRDEGLRALFRGLAVHNPGLCFVTTRQCLPDLNAHRKACLEWELLHLSKHAGAKLLDGLGVKGTRAEREKLSVKVQGHALTLTLLGTYLEEAHHGDIRRVDRLNFEKVNLKVQGGHAFRVMAAYVRWFKKENCLAELAILQILGLFDRPATPDCLAILRDSTVNGLTDALKSLNEEDWSRTVTHLEKLRLIVKEFPERTTITGYDRHVAALKLRDPDYKIKKAEPFFSRHSSGFIHHSLDAHPLVREFFGAALRQKSVRQWREANARLWEHLESSLPHWPDGIESVKPLCQAIPHGCEAGRAKAATEVFFERIERGDREKYLTRGLGGYQTALVALNKLAGSLDVTVSPLRKAQVLADWGVALRAVGRMREAESPMSQGVLAFKELKNWDNAAKAANDFSKLCVDLGKTVEAIRSAKSAVELAKRHASANKIKENWLCEAYHSLGAAYHQAGQWKLAARQFPLADKYQIADRTDLQGYHYGDFELSLGERLAWWRWLRSDDPPDCDEAIRRCELTKKYLQERYVAYKKKPPKSRVREALNRFTYARANFYMVILSGELKRKPRLAQACEAIEAAVNSDSPKAASFRNAGQGRDFARGLLGCVWAKMVLEPRSDEAIRSAVAALDEAWEIAVRGPMPFLCADIHLYRARLFFREEKYPWNETQNCEGKLVSNRTAKDDLDDAEFLIEFHSYHRRDKELDDAKKAILGL